MKRIVFYLCLIFILVKSVIAQPPPPPPPPMKTYPLTAWKEFDFADAWFSVSFPTKPKESKKTEAVNDTPIETTTYEVRTGDGSYTVICTKLPQKPDESEEHIKERLRETLKRLAQGKQYKWIGGKEIQMDGYPGIEFQYELLDGQELIWQRMYSINDRVYRIISDTFRREPALKEPQVFHDSFKFAPPPPPPPAPGQNIGGTAKPSITRVSGGVLSGAAVKKVQPQYPKAAKAERATGPVQVAILVSEEGKVIEANAVSGHEALRAASVEAAKQWVFKPIELSGVPVKIQGILTFNFTLQ